VAAPGKLPVHLEGLVLPDPEDNVGLRIRERASGRVLAYFSAIGKLSRSVLQALDGVDCVFFDGTFWSSDELSGPGLMAKTAEDLAHLRWAARTGASRRSPGSPPGGGSTSISTIRTRSSGRTRERRAVEAAGCEVAFDGMEVTL